MSVAAAAATVTAANAAAVETVATVSAASFYPVYSLSGSGYSHRTAATTHDGSVILIPVPRYCHIQRTN